MIWLLTLALAGPAPAHAPHGTAPPHDSRPSLPSPVATPSRGSTAGEVLASQSRQIRGLDRRTDALIAEGARRSETFASLVSDLHETDVIVYVEATFSLPPKTAGRLLLQAVTGARRYVRVQVRASLQRDHIIAVLAHELRHALEVGADRSVIDDSGLVALYSRIGHVSRETLGYDTQAARDAGEQVLEELLGARPRARGAPGA